jgi:hypothetical protein
MAVGESILTPVLTVWRFWKRQSCSTRAVLSKKFRTAKERDSVDDKRCKISDITSQQIRKIVVIINGMEIPGNFKHPFNVCSIGLRERTSITTSFLTLRSVEKEKENISALGS